MNELDGFRAEIDRIDTELAHLLELRFDLCEEIGRTPVYYTYLNIFLNLYYNFFLIIFHHSRKVLTYSFLIYYFLSTFDKKEY